MYDSKDCIVHVPAGKKVVIQGLDNCIVVEANGTLMIINKDDEQNIKEYSKKADQE